METQGADTSFDVIGDKSQLRHFKIVDRVRKGLQKSLRQPDQTESELQRLKDEAKKILDGVLLDDSKLSDELVSAEFYAERLDIALWARYRKSSSSSFYHQHLTPYLLDVNWSVWLTSCFTEVNHHVVEKYPFDGPKFEQSHDGTSAPEHFRIRESLKQPTETVAGPSSSAAPARRPPQAEDDGKVQAGLDNVTESLENLDLSQTRSHFFRNKSPSPSPLSSLGEKSVEWTFTSTSRSPSPIAPLPSPPVPLTEEQKRARYTSATLDFDAVMNKHRRDERDRAQAKADEAGLSLGEYYDKEAPIKDKFTLETEAQRIAAQSSISKPVTKPVTKPDSKADSKADSKPDSKPVSKPVSKPATERSSEPAKKSWADIVDEEELEPVQAQAVPPAPKPHIPLAGLAKPKPVQAPPVSQPSTAPKDKAEAAQKAAAAQKAPPKEKPIVRPVREHLAQNVRERVLPLKLRQEIWDEHFPNCQRQEGAEPLQVQIPSNKRSSLLIGQVLSNDEGTKKVIFDELQTYLPCGIDVIYQDAADKRFGLTLLYIGLKHNCKFAPRSHVSISSLQSAWDILFHWACLVEQRYEIDVARFAQWKLDEEIEARYYGILDRDGSMAKAVAFVEKANIPIAQPVVKPRGKQAPRQHQVEVSAERRAANNKLSAMRENIKRQEKEAIFARVGPIIDACRVEDGKAFDADALDDKFFGLALESGEPRARAVWIHEGSTAWRKQNLEENSKEQVLFDRAVGSWWTNFLGFESMEQSRRS